MSRPKTLSRLYTNQEHSHSGNTLVRFRLEANDGVQFVQTKANPAVLFERLYWTYSTIAMLLAKEKLLAMSTANKLTFVLLQVISGVLKLVLLPEYFTCFV